MENIQSDKYICKYCNKKLSNNSSLNLHIKTAKYCIKIQENESDNKKIKFNCSYCLKNFSTKQNLNIHLKKCKKFGEKKMLEEKYNTDIKLQVKVEELENFIKIQEKQFEKRENVYKEQIRDLQDKLQNLATIAINRPTITNNNTNNTLNISSFIDFNDVDKAKSAIRNNLNINHIVDGQRGLARFVKDTLLTDENGNLTYLCTDPSRNVFKYKDSTGEIKKDVEAKKLTDYIIKGGIRIKSADIGNEWCKDDSGDINMDKFNIMLDQQQSIMKLSDDNNSFKKELASLTS